MTLRKIYFGSVGPFLYDDADPIDDLDGDFAGEDYRTIVTDGQIRVEQAPGKAKEVLRLEDLDFRLLPPVSVANVDNPTELNSLAGDLGALVLAYEIVGATGQNEYTIYAYDASGPGVNSPYVVDAGGVGDERWIAIAGKYAAQGFDILGNIALTGTVDGVDVAAFAAAYAAHIVNVNAHHAQIHAATHVTGGGDTVANAIPAGNSGLMSGADKTKLDGIEAGAKVGDVVGPAAATDNAIARFNLATGKLIQNSASLLDDSGNPILPKASGIGIKIDVAAPTFGWRDLLGVIRTRGVGATDPNDAVYRGNIRQYNFSVNDEAWIEYHIPHDYVIGSDIFLHLHWSHIGALVTGGTVTWGADITYAKGHNQAAFPATVNPTVVGGASVIQYQHIITEVQVSAGIPSGVQIDSDDLEPDGVILARVYLSANNITVSGGAVPDPFLHFADIHYQTTNIGTKQKAPNFYV